MNLQIIKGLLLMLQKVILHRKRGTGIACSSFGLNGMSLIAFLPCYIYSDNTTKKGCNNKSQVVQGLFQ